MPNVNENSNVSVLVPVSDFYSQNIKFGNESAQVTMIVLTISCVFESTMIPAVGSILSYCSSI